jgi:hypothetical protein
MIAIMTLNAFHAPYNEHGLFTAKIRGRIGLLTGFIFLRPVGTVLYKTLYGLRNVSQF